MKSIRIHKHGNHEVLKIDNIESPICNNNQVKIKIKACALNHLDIWVRNGLPGLPIKLPLIMGSDASGSIVETGSKIKNYNINDDVVIQPGTFDKNTSIPGKENYSKSYGILGETSNGTQAEYVCLNEHNIYKMPKHLTFEESSSMQLVFMTAYQMLIKRANLQNNDNLLIYGGTSGIGSAAIQIAKDIGANVVSTVGHNDKIEHAYKMGADYVVIHNENLIDNLSKINKIKFNVIFEHIGLKTWEQSLRLLDIGGRIVTCGSTTGAKVNIDLRHLFSKQQSILGSTMSDIDTFNQVMDKIINKKYFPFIDKVYKFKNVQQAHLRMEKRMQIGKIILIP